MSAAIFPFPLAKRRTMIDCRARYANELSLNAAERHIRRQLRIQGDAMRRKGIDDDLISRELRCMECVVDELLTRKREDKPKTPPGSPPQIECVNILPASSSNLGNDVPF
jgi:hypothetical protein